MSKAHTVSLTLNTSRWQQSALSTRPLFRSLWTGYLKIIIIKKKHTQKHMLVIHKQIMFYHS